MSYYRKEERIEDMKDLAHDIVVILVGLFCIVSTVLYWGEKLYDQNINNINTVCGYTSFSSFGFIKLRGKITNTYELRMERSIYMHMHR